MTTIGVFGIAYGIYEMYSLVNMWPPEVRDDLRVAIRAKHREDFRTSAMYFEKAYGIAISLPNPEKAFGDDHVLKISAIALALAGVLELSGELGKAYSAYQTALADLRLGMTSTSKATQRTRAVGTAMKLVEVGEVLLEKKKQKKKGGKEGDEYGPEDENEVEGYLTWALEETLRSVVPAPAALATTKQPEQSPAETEQSIQLPRWADDVDLAFVLERAGAFYAKRGKAEYTAPLYLHAISVLLPPSGPLPSMGDQCKAATLMNNLSSIFAASTPVNIVQATAWAQKALEVAQRAKSSSLRATNDDVVECDRTLAVILFNLGMLSEMSKDNKKAITYYTQALEQSRAVDMKEGVLEAQGALKRLWTLI